MLVFLLRLVMVIAVLNSTSIALFPTEATRDSQQFRSVPSFVVWIGAKPEMYWKDSFWSFQSCMYYAWMGIFNFYSHYFALDESCDFADSQDLHYLT